MNNFRRIMGFMGKNLYLYFLGIFGIALLNMFFQLKISQMFKKMFDLIENNNFKAMLIVVRNDAFILIGIFIIMPFFLFITQKVAAWTSGIIRITVFQKLTNLPLSFFKKYHSGEIISKMTNDISETEKIYKNNFVNFITNIITGVGSTIFMFFLEWRLALIAILGGILTLVVNLYFSKRLRIISSLVQEKLAKLNEKLANILIGMSIIRIFNLSSIMLNKFKLTNDEVYHVTNKRINNQALIDALNSLIAIISFIGIVTLGSYLIIIGETTVGTIVAVVQIENGVGQLINSLGTFITQNQAALASSSRLFALLDEKVEADYYYDTSINHHDVINFNNVAFSYDEKELIKDLSFSIASNKVYALVGASGSGKSTVLKLLLQFYAPSSGQISISDKTNIKEIRDLLAYVPQDAFLFSGTIKENIAYGKPTASKEEIIAAAKYAYAHDFIMTFEAGYETKVLENGAKLSGGQRQRIAIARAFLKNAPILLLDEATSSLDSESEELIQASLANLMKDRTTIIIAHRLSTVKNADQILVLDGGAIVERGTHEELIKLNNYYANLYQKQFV